MVSLVQNRHVDLFHFEMTFFFSENFPEDFGANRVTADVATPLIFVCKQLSLPHGRFAPLGLMLCGCVCEFQKEHTVDGQIPSKPVEMVTPPKFNSSPLKNNDWKTMFSS